MKAIGTISTVFASATFALALFSLTARGEGYPYGTGALPPSIGPVQALVKVTQKVGEKTEELCSRNETFTVYDVRTQPAPAGTPSGTRFQCEAKFSGGKVAQVQVDVALSVLSRRNLQGASVDAKRFELKATLLDGSTPLNLGESTTDVPALTPAPGLTLLVTKALTGDAAHDGAELTIEAEFDRAPGALPSGTASPTPAASPFWSSPSAWGT